MNDAKVFCVIVAAGSGSRFGGDLPKQFVDLLGRPVLMHTIDNVRNAIECELVLVISPQHRTLWRELCSKHSFESPILADGGATRIESVENALKILSDKIESQDDIILVHDGARPLVSASVVEELVAQINAGHSGAVPCLPMVDSVRRVSADGKSQWVDRAELRCVQTPQAFKAQKLINAYADRKSDNLTDDASVVEDAGDKDIVLVEGSGATIKITHEMDLKIVAAYLSNSTQWTD